MKSERWKMDGALFGRDPQIVPHLALGEGKPKSLGDNKRYRSHTGQDSSFPAWECIL